MHSISPAKTALSLGAVISFYRIIWATLVAVGWAKPLMDFILRIHFIRLQYDVTEFVFSTAATLAALTFCLGAFFGYMFALVWNWLAAEKVPEKSPYFRAQA